MAPKTKGKLSAKARASQGMKVYYRAHSAWYRQRHEGYIHQSTLRKEMKDDFDTFDEALQQAYRDADEARITTDEDPPTNENNFTWPPCLGVLAARGDDSEVDRRGIQTEIREEAPAVDFEDPGEATGPSCPGIRKPDQPRHMKGADFLSLNTKDIPAVHKQDQWRWFPQKLVGRGGYGRATLWLKTDARNTQIIDRLVAKDVDLAPRWTDRSAWTKDKGKVPMEVAIHSTLSNGTSPYILKFRGYRLNRLLRVMRLSTEFIEGGSFYDLVESFAISEDSVVSSYDHKDYKHIPVLFAWKVLSAVVDAAIHLNNHNVVHRDLKLENLLVDDDKSENMGGWGIKPVLADFRHAMPMQSDRFDNPDDFNESGTVAYFAPEQYMTSRSLFGDKLHPPIGEKTTVFHIGVLMHKFVHGLLAPRLSHPLHDRSQGDHYDESLWSYLNNNLPPKDDEDKALLKEWLFNEEYQRHKKWSALTRHFQSFQEVIIYCLRFHPDNRPTLDHLRDLVDESLDLFKDDVVDSGIFRDKKRNADDDEKVGNISDNPRAKKRTKVIASGTGAAPATIAAP